ncbi:hypothetical protein FRC03_004740 [Tulasnella sp. 419]|nr:hypothetical protein FRC03_004740 [Tulasnella sp. 419]
MESWAEVNPITTTSAKGWADDELGLEYIKNFDEQTKPKNDLPWVLMLMVTAPTAPEHSLNMQQQIISMLLPILPTALMHYKVLMWHVSVC